MTQTTQCEHGDRAAVPQPAVTPMGLRCTGPTSAKPKLISHIAEIKCVMNIASRLVE
jgi:hypothetical protein